MMLDMALDALEKTQLTYRNVFKLTGRYVLNDKFNYDTFDNQHNVFKRAVSGALFNFSVSTFKVGLRRHRLQARR